MDTILTPPAGGLFPAPDEDRPARGTENQPGLGPRPGKKNARAFAALMRHVKEVDRVEHTVIMVQVENEPIAGLATVEEGNFVNGWWVPGRLMAGDSADEGGSIRIAWAPGSWAPVYRQRSSADAIQRVTLYRYR